VSSKPKRVVQTHTPELRAQIAKYALQNGIHQALHHFKVTMNLDLPESTVRAMRNKLVNKKSRLEELQEHLDILGGQPKVKQIKMVMPAQKS